MENARAEFDERKKELKKEGDWFGDNGSLIKLMFGNQYEKVNNPVSYDKAGKNLLAHRWAIFLTLDNDVQLTERYIKEV